MAATTQAVDASEIYEMWNFGNDSGAMPLEDSSGSSSDEDVKKSAPKNKRRKSQHAEVPDLIVLDDDETEDSDTDLEIENQLQKKREKAKKKNGTAFDDLKIVVQHKPVPRMLTEEEQQATLKMKNSLLSLQRLKSQMESAALPPEDDASDGEQQDSEKDDSDKEQESEKEPAEKEPEERVVVKIRWAQDKDPAKLRIAKNLPMERLFESFRTFGEKKELFYEDEELKFDFDGERIQPNQTAEDLDIDDDCVIDVHW